MLAAQLINTSFPSVHLLDKASFALQLMEDYDVQHLCVVTDEKFVGIVDKNTLLDTPETAVIATMQDEFIVASVHADEHFLAGTKLLSLHELTMLPVVSTTADLLGVITAKHMLAALTSHVGADMKGGVIVLEMEQRQYSFGEIARLVETNDAYVTQLNTATDTQTGMLLVTLQINRIEVSTIVATFQRYDYSVKYYFGEENYQNELKENYNHLLSYLNM
jgi:CBS-domain-containing membrane protein